MSTVRRQIEDAVVGALVPLRSQGLITARAWNGLVVLEDLGDIKRVTNGQYPAALVSAPARSYRTAALSRRRSIGEQRIEVVVAAASLRSREEQTRDVVTGGSAGAYALMEIIQGALLGLDLGVPGVGVVSAVSEDVVARVPDMTVWLMIFNVEVDVAVPKRIPAGTPDLTSIMAKLQPPEAEALLTSGIGDALAMGTTTTTIDEEEVTVTTGVMTLTDAAGLFLVGYVGERVRIAGAMSAGNNGIFTITGVPSATEVEFTNAAGVTEAFTGTWAITPQPFVEALAVSP